MCKTSKAPFWNIFRNLIQPPQLSAGETGTEVGWHLALELHELMTEM